MSTESSTSRQAPQPLPLPWVDRIFARMEGLYGTLFLDRWRGCDIENVRQTWADELGGFSGHPQAISDALRALTERQFPPTLPEFLGMCRDALRRNPSGPALPPPPIDMATARERLAQLKRRFHAQEGLGVTSSDAA